MTETTIDALRAFGDKYEYDTSYMEFMHAAAPAAFDAFSSVQGLSELRDGLARDESFVARIATMQGADCGPCAQLNLRMAAEAGVRRELLTTLIEAPADLPPDLRDVRDHALTVARGEPSDPVRVQRLRRSLGDRAFVELGVCIAGSSLFPTLKRALGYDAACAALTLDF